MIKSLSTQILWITAWTFKCTGILGEEGEVLAHISTAFWGHFERGLTKMKGMTAHRFNYSEELAHVKVVINCRNSIAQMCTREDLLARLCSMYCHTIRFLRSPLKVLLVFCPPPHRLHICGRPSVIWCTILWESVQSLLDIKYWFAFNTFLRLDYLWYKM